MAHAAKSGINVLVVRLEPVAKRAAQHAGGGARGTTFEHVVFSVEKAGRVARIEGERLESRKRLKQTRSPFPAIAHQVGNPEGTPSCGTVGRRRRIPALKVKVAVPQARRLGAPWIGSFRVSPRSIRRPMPVRLGGQRLPGPTRVRARFRVAHVLSLIHICNRVEAARIARTKGWL